MFRKIIAQSTVAPDIPDGQTVLLADKATEQIVSGGTQVMGPIVTPSPAPKHEPTLEELHKMLKPIVHFVAEMLKESNKSAAVNLHEVESGRIPMEIFRNADGVAIGVRYRLPISSKINNGLGSTDERIEYQTIVVSKLGGEGAKSTVYKVSCGDQFIIKVPPVPIKNYDQYLKAFAHEKKIADKLRKRGLDVMVPGIVSVLGKVIRFPSGALSLRQVDQLLKGKISTKTGSGQSKLVSQAFRFSAPVGKPKELNSLIIEFNGTNEAVRNKLNSFITDANSALLTWLQAQLNDESIIASLFVKLKQQPSPKQLWETLSSWEERKIATQEQCRKEMNHVLAHLDIAKRNTIIETLLANYIAPSVVEEIVGLKDENHNGMILPADDLEDEYGQLLQKGAYKEYQKMLKIAGNFVFVVSLVKEQFLSDQIRSLADVTGIAKELLKDKPTREEPLKTLLDSYATAVRKLWDQSKITLTDYKVRTCFDDMLLRQTVRLRDFFSDQRPDSDANWANMINKLNDLNRTFSEKNKPDIDKFLEPIIREATRLKQKQSSPYKGKLANNLLGLLVSAYAAGVVIRDLKPENLYVKNEKTGGLGIIDLETSRGFDSSDVWLAGTPGYLSFAGLLNHKELEAVYGQENIKNVLHLMDWFSSLAMIYRLVTTKSLFEGDATKLIGSMSRKIVEKFYDGLKTVDIDILKSEHNHFWKLAEEELMSKINADKDMLKAIPATLESHTKDLFKKQIEAIKVRRNKAIKIKLVRSGVNNLQVLSNPEPFLLTKKAQLEKVSDAQPTENLKKELPFINTLLVEIEKNRSLEIALANVDSAYELIQLMFEITKQGHQWQDTAGTP